MAKPGVFCLEGQWKRSLADDTSVRHLLECLGAVGKAKTVYKDVHTPEELHFLLDKWCQRGYSEFNVLWLAFHGYRGGIHIGNVKVSLDDLAERYRGRFKGRIIYFASCSTMRTTKIESLTSFCKVTGARAIAGYTRDVDWLEAAAFELLMLFELATSQHLGHMRNRLERAYGDLHERLGFKLVRPGDPRTAS